MGSPIVSVCVVFHVHVLVAAYVCSHILVHVVRILVVCTYM